MLSVSILSILGHKKLLIIDVAFIIDGYGNACFVLEEVWTPPKSAPNSDILGMHLELVYLAWIGIVPNSTILLIHISIHPKMGLIAKDDLFGLISNCSKIQSANTRLSMFTLSSWIS